MNKLRYIIINALLAAMGYALWKAWREKEEEAQRMEEEDDLDDFIGEPSPVIDIGEEETDEELPGRGLGEEDFDEFEGLEKETSTDLEESEDELPSRGLGEDDLDLEHIDSGELEEVAGGEDELEDTDSGEEEEGDRGNDAEIDDSTESFEEENEGEEIESQPVLVVDETLPWHIGQYHIDKIWEETKGEGVKVAILDSGISHGHPDLECIDSRNFVGNDPHETEDKIGHGTHCSGIVCAKNSQRVKGIAPGAELFVAKITDSDWESDKPPVLEALEWAVDIAKADIVLMSFSDFDKNEKLKDYIKKIKSNVLCISATSNYCYPAFYEGCFGVADIGKNGEMDEDFDIFEAVSLIAPGIGIESTYKDSSYETLDGSSMAAAYTVGVCALLKSYSNKHSVQLSPADCFHSLIDTAKDIDTSQGSKKLIVPLDALQSLKNKITIA